jgi:UDP-N-acetylglucosamine 2-epimerase (non-hydrolysing)
MAFIDIIAGARPNFMKIAPIIEALEERRRNGGRLGYRLIHTGQHYDRNMSGAFFDQLGIPEPEINLEVGSGTQARQMGEIMVRYEKVLAERRSDACMVVGDVTSTMACAITAQKECIPVAHVEGGIRSGDWTMPEEINRMATDAVTNWFFTTSETANENLRRAGVEEERVFFVGNTMIDTLLKHRGQFVKPAVWEDAGLEEKKYFVLTLHRPANVDEEGKLKELMETLVAESRGLPMVFPVHPRTAKIFARLGIETENLKIVDPLSYLEFNYLVERAFGVVTDSGGITEETTVMGVPCLTLRDNTERPETVTVGTNELVGTDPTKIPPVMGRLFAGKWKKGGIPEMWDGMAGRRIAERMEEIVD